MGNRQMDRIYRKKKTKKQYKNNKTSVEMECL